MNRISSFRTPLSRTVGRYQRSVHSGAESQFNKESEVTATADPTRFSGYMTKNWSVGDAPNGGMQMAIAISAARKVIPFRDPLTMTAYYCNKALEEEAVDIEVKTLNATKGSATVTVSLTQQGVLRSHYIGTFSSLESQKGLNFSNLPQAPQLPPPDECVDCSAKLRKKFGEHLRVAQRVEFRAPKDDPFVLGVLAQQKVDTASLSCWVRFEGGEKLPCLRSMALFCDVLPPPILAVQSSNWVPTLEYTVHFWQRADFSKRGVPATDKATGTGENSYWLRLKYHTPVSINGVLYTDGELWSEDGTALLATSRQLAKVLTPR